MLHVNNLHITAGDFQVHSASLHVGKGEYYFLLGESGSGKSLILEAIAGIQPVKQGIIWVNGIDITHLPMYRRNVGVVFQNLALFPHKTVFQNIAFPLQQLKFSKEDIITSVKKIAAQLSISSLLHRFPGTLSGGEHQRVALARTLIMKPAVLLLDEPLSSLDILLKEEMMELLQQVHSNGQSILHVTHDYHVVAKLADRISIIEKGVILQTGTQQEIRKHPSCKLASRL